MAINLRPEDLRKNYIDVLQKYMGLFEEYLENCPEFIEVDNFPDYREAVRKYNEISPNKYDARGTFHKLDDIENQKES